MFDIHNRCFYSLYKIANCLSSPLPFLSLPSKKYIDCRSGRSRNAFPFSTFLGKKGILDPRHAGWESHQMIRTHHFHGWALVRVRGGWVWCGVVFTELTFPPRSRSATLRHSECSSCDRKARNGFGRCEHTEKEWGWDRGRRRRRKVPRHVKSCFFLGFCHSGQWRQGGGAKIRF